MEQASSSPIRLVYLYASEDLKLCKRLEKHLSLLQRQKIIATWYAQKIGPGAEWELEIDQQIRSAHIILLCISADFIASDYCYSIEMAHALKRHEAGEAVVIPILLRPADWKSAPFGKLLALPSDGRAVTSWPNRDQAFAHIVKGIRKVIAQISPSEPGSLTTLSTTTPIWMVPYRRNPLFTGREKLLEQLANSLHGSKETAASPKIVALCGLGGSGKTQLAIEYLYRYQQQYQALLWLNAATPDTLAADLISLAGYLGISNRDEKEQQIIINAVKRWLTEHHRWLLILDNVAHPNTIYDFVPTQCDGHIILTTRAQATGSAVHNIMIQEMEREEGITFLLWRAKVILASETLEHVSQEDILAAQDIMMQMDGLPLALDQAGAYIEESGCSVAEYAERYTQREIALLKRRGETHGDHPASVATTLSLSLEAVEPHNPLAAEMLRFCAFLAPDAIPQELLTSAAELSPHLYPLVTDASLLDEAIATLRHFSLIHRNRATKTLTVHRLVQAVLKAEMDHATQRHWAEQVLQAMIKTFPARHEAAWAHCQRYLAQVYACKTFSDEFALRHAEAPTVFYRAGRWLHEQAHYKDAEELYHYALTLKEEQQGQDPAVHAHILDSLAWLYLDQAIYYKAHDLYRRALDLKQRYFGVEYPEVAITLHGLGRLHQAQSHYPQAEACYQQALTIKERSFGPEHYETATTLHALAWLYHEQKRYIQAEPLYQRALTIRQQVLGMKHVSTAITLHQLAWLYHEQRHYAQAEPLYQQALAIKEQTLDPQHPFIAITLHYLGRLYHDQRRYAQAEPLYQRALAIREHTLGPDHSFTAASLHALARLYHDQQRYSQAEPLYQRALAIRTRVFGAEHPITAITLHQLARLYEAQHEQKQADMFYQRTLSIREMAYGCTHMSTRIVAQEYVHFLTTIQQDVQASEVKTRYQL